jgi:anti-sigma factor RsiW
VEHLTQKQIEDYSQHRLDAAGLLAMGDHVAGCEACRLRVEAGMNGDAAFYALHSETIGDEFPAHLTADQTAEYVDKNLSGEALQVVTDHLAGCEQCLMAVEDLRAFRNEIAPSLDREYRPAVVASPVVRESWFTRFRSLFRVSPVPAFGGAALALLLLGVIAWLVWRTPTQREPQIAEAPTPVSQPSASVEPVTPQPSPPTVVAELNDGGRILTLDQQGKLSGADDLPAGYRDLVTRALSTQRIEKSSQLQGLTRPPSSLMSGDNQNDQFSVLQPAGNVLLEDKPAFRWSTLEGATGYVVEVYDEQFNPVASSPQLTNPSWTTTLPRGHVYSWQVKALKEGQEITSPRPPAPQAKFRVLDQSKANELARAKRAYGSSHLTLALLYADAGLLKEAEQELRLVQRSNPNSDLARKLLRQIQSLRR